MQTQEQNVALPLRSYTILGVCEAIGEDFRFNPIFLRVPFAASVIWSPMWAVAAYMALGMAVLISRLAAPKAKPSSVAASTAATTSAVVANDEREMAKAA